MSQSKTLPYYRLLFLWYFLPEGASSENCIKGSGIVEYCSWSCCGSGNSMHCCMSPYDIAGILIGCIVCLVITGSVIFCLCLYKKQRSQVVNNPQSQRVFVLSGNVPQQQYNFNTCYNTSYSGYNTQYNGTPPPPYSHQAKYPPVPPVPPAYTTATSPPPAYTYNLPGSNTFSATASNSSTATARNPFAAAANQAAGRTTTAK